MDLLQRVNDFNKIKKIIESCNTQEQLNVAKRMIKLYQQKHLQKENTRYSDKGKYYLNLSLTIRVESLQTFLELKKIKLNL